MGPNSGQREHGVWRPVRLADYPAWPDKVSVTAPSNALLGAFRRGTRVRCFFEVMSAYGNWYRISKAESLCLESAPCPYSPRGMSTNHMAGCVIWRHPFYLRGLGGLTLVRTLSCR